MLWYIGDLHGEVDDIMKVDRAAAKAGITHVIQVGDFGIRWTGRPCSIYKYFSKKKRKDKPGPTWITCGGNHDNWDKWFKLSHDQGEPSLVELAPNVFYAQRGSYHIIEGVGHLFLGGAESTDKHIRVKGKDWWAAETPTYADFCLAMARLETCKPEVMITHDAPTCVEIKRTQRDHNPTPRNLNNLLLYSNYKPPRWYYGHHHTMNEDTINNVNFYCCGLGGQYKQYPPPE